MGLQSTTASLTRGSVANLCLGHSCALMAPNLPHPGDFYQVALYRVCDKHQAHTVLWLWTLGQPGWALLALNCPCTLPG